MRIGVPPFPTESESCLQGALVPAHSRNSSSLGASMLNNCKSPRLLNALWTLNIASSLRFTTAIGVNRRPGVRIRIRIRIRVMVRAFSLFDQVLGLGLDKLV